MDHFSFNPSRFLLLVGASMALAAFSGCAAPAQTPGPRTAAGVWQVRLPESTSPIASKAHGSRGDGLAWDARGSDSIDEFLRDDQKRVAAPRARTQHAVARTQPLPKAPAPQPAPAALPPAPEPQPLLASATPAERPATDELSRYADRDAQSQKAQRFSGGEAVIVISATTVLIVLLIILIIVLID